MKKYAAAAIIAALALSGCATAQATTSVPVVQGPPTSDGPTQIPTMAQYVRAGWSGPNRPDEHWIATSIMLLCKREIGGYSLDVLPHSRYSAKNNDVLIAAAAAYNCGELVLKP